MPGDEILATDQGARGRMVRPWREADGRILFLRFRSISFLIRDSFSTIILDFQRLSNVANFSFTKVFSKNYIEFNFTKVIPYNVIDFNFTKVVS